MIANTNPRILIVREDGPAADRLKENLQDLGYESCAAVSGSRRSIEEALQSRPDLALVDLGLEGDPDGVEAGAELGRRDVPVIYLTGGEAEDLMQRAGETRPFFGFVLEPVDRRQLQLSIRTALSLHGREREHLETRSALENKVEEQRGRISILEAVLDGVDDGVLAIDEDGKYQVYNSKANSLFGSSEKGLGLGDRSQAYGLFYPDRVTPYPNDELPLRRALDGESHSEVEMFVRNPDAPDGVFVSVSSRPLRDLGDGVRRSMISCRDISRAKESKDEARQNARELSLENQFMKASFDLLDEGIVYSDQTNRILYMNSQARRLFVTEAVILDSALGERSKRYGLFFPDQETYVPAEELPLVRAVSGEDTEETEFFVRNENNPDGLRISIRGHSMGLRTKAPTKGGMAIVKVLAEDGEIEPAAQRRAARPRARVKPDDYPAAGDGKRDAAAGTFAAEPDYRSSEAEMELTIRELRDQAEFFEAICDNIDDGIVVVDQRGKLVFANFATEKIFGEWVADPEAGKWSETFGIFYPDIKTFFPDHRLPLLRALMGEVTEEVEMFVRNEKNREGTYIIARGRPIYDRERTKLIGALGIIRDITHVKQSESRLNQAAADLNDQTRLMETVFNGLNDGVVVVDKTGKILLVNPSLRRIFAMDPVEAVKPEAWAETYGIFQMDRETPVPFDQIPLNMALKGEKTGEMEFFVKNDKNETGSYITASANPMLSVDSGEVVGSVGIVRDITKRKLAEAQLEKTMDELRHQTHLMEAVFNSMDEGVCVADSKGRFLLFNSRAQEIVGKDFADSDPTNWPESYGAFYLDKKTRFAVEELPMVRAINGETVQDHEMFLRNEAQPDGVFLSSTGGPLPSADGRDTQTGVVVFRDITRYKESEARLEQTITELQNQAELMETVFNSISDGVVVADADGNFTLFNPGAEQIVGIGGLEIPPDQWTDRYGLFYLDEKTHVPTEEVPLVRAIMGDAVDDMEIFCRNEERPDGVFLNVSGRPLRKNIQGHGGGVVVFQDITKRKRAEAQLQKTMEQLRNQNELMETTFNSISDGIVVADEKGEFLYVNPGAVQITGMGPTEGPQEEWSETYGTFYLDRETPVKTEDLPLLRAIFKGESTDDEDLFMRNGERPDGVYIRVSGRPLLNQIGGIRGGVIIFRDVTEQMIAEEALARAFAQGRLEIVDTILHNIGNAINSVTVGIETVHQSLVDNQLLRRFRALAEAVEARRDDWTGYISNDPQGQKVLPFVVALAKDFSTQSEGLTQTVERVKDRANRIADIVRTQKALGNPNMDRKDLNLEAALQSAVRVLQDSLKKREIEIEVDCSDAPEEIRIQDSQFHQMMVNLIKNSIEAIDELAASSGLRDVPRIVVRAYKQGDFLHLDVTDNGIGIDKKNPKVLFAAGYTTKKSGSGLGLHSAANFVIGSGGQIRPLSEGTGKGVTMRVMMRLSSIAPIQDPRG